MKKRIVWLTAAAMAFGLVAQAETVITSPTGLPDESDVVLESAVDAVKTLPAETVESVSGAAGYTFDELRNSAYAVKGFSKGTSPREAVRKDMLKEVSGTWNPSGDIVFRSYTVSPAISEAMGLKGVPQGDFLDVRGFFGGVDFPKGTSASFQPGCKELLVRNTADSLLRIEKALAQYKRAENDYPQIVIKAKFIEVSQTTLNQLGFNWQITENTQLPDGWQLDSQKVLDGALRSAAGAFGGAPGAGSMVMTKTGWLPLRLAIDALEQTGDSDVLSSPSLTTLDGKAAEIWVGEDRMVPQAFDVKSSDVNIHVQHKNWNSELMGVHFTVTPKIQQDNQIRLLLNPKVVDLVGYDVYAVSPEANMLMVNGESIFNAQQYGRFPILNAPAAGIHEAWDQMSTTLGGTDPNTPGLNYYSSSRRPMHDEYGVPLAAINGKLPYFRVREIKTQVVVADGSTVGLGGLIYDRLETYKDKVPVLGSIPLIGRLFRSEGERSIKRNLMIFVSASQVDNDGQLKSNVAINK
jgi:general secretion pathway protein D